MASPSPLPPAPGRRVLEGVGHQVDQHLPQTVGVGGDQRQALRHVGRQFDPLVRRRRFQVLQQVDNQLRQIQGSHVQGEAAHLRQRQVPQIAHQAAEAEALLRRRLVNGEIDEAEYLRLKAILSK